MLLKPADIVQRSFDECRYARWFLCIYQAKRLPLQAINQRQITRIMTTGDKYQHSFQFSQKDVIRFAEVSGDNNPLHLDAEFAASTPFKKPIIHGILGASIFSNVIGTKFPGAGSVYVKQSLEFLRPMFVDAAYEARFEIVSINGDKHTAEISTEIIDAQTKKVTTRGVAVVMNKEHF